MKSMRASRAVGIWARVILGLLLGIALMHWPYGCACGPQLFFYLTAAGALVVTGLWAALLSWKRRQGAAYAVALGTMLWGAVLVAAEVLPRTDYTKISATWWCADFGAESGAGPRLALGSPAAQ